MTLDRFSGSVVVSCCLGLVLVSADSATAQDEQPQTSKRIEAKAAHGPFDLDYEYLTGDWGGVRTELEDAGIKFKIILMNQVMVNMHGGKETKNGHDTAGSYELSLYLDLEKMKLIEGAEFFIRGKGTWGGDDSDFDKEKIGGFIGYFAIYVYMNPVRNNRKVIIDKAQDIFIGRLVNGRVVVKLALIERVPVQPGALRWRRPGRSLCQKI